MKRKKSQVSTARAGAAPDPVAHESGGLAGRLWAVLAGQFESPSLPFVAAIHLVFAGFLFSPFLCEGMALLPTTDHVLNYLPAMLFMKDAFGMGELGLWNPFVAGGLDYSASAYSYLYSPFAWVLCLVPRSLFAVAYTAMTLIVHWLIGVFGFLAIDASLKSRRWAFFGSLVYQLGSLGVYSITLCSLQHEFLLTTIAYYLLFTMDRAKPQRSYLLLTLVLTLIIMCGQLVQASYTLLSVPIVFALYTAIHFPGVPLALRRWGIFALAGATALMIGAVRLLPFVGAFREGVRPPLISFGENTKIIFHFFSFVPESLGWTFRGSLPILAKTDHPTHIHQTAGIYFGAVPVLLCIFAVCAIRKSRALAILSIYLAVVALWLANVSPVSAALTIATFPFWHHQPAVLLFPMPMCLLLGEIGRRLEDDPTVANRRNILALLCLAAVALAGPYEFWLKFFPEMLGSVRVTAVACAGTIAVVYALYGFREKLRGARRAVFLSAVLAPVGLLALVIVGRPVYDAVVHLESPHASALTNTANVYVGGTIVATAGLALAVAACAAKVRFAPIAAVPAALAVALVVLLAAWPVHLSDIPSVADSFLSFRLGAVRFMLAAVALIAVLAYAKFRPEGKRRLMPLLAMLTIVDLLPFNKMYLHVGAQPFVPANSYYSKDRVEEIARLLDLRDFRVNHPHLALGLVGWECPSNITGNFGIRSYGGSNSIYPKPYFSFWRNFDIGHSDLDAQGHIACLSTDNRFLDLVGAGYDVGERIGQIVVRPNALSRFMLFTEYEVRANEEDALRRLKDESLTPTRTLVVSRLPEGSPPTRPGDARVIKAGRQAFSRIELDVDANQSALLFFGDSYDPGWRATVNGVPREIVPADFHFMAVPVGAGHNRVVLEFRPPLFQIGACLAGAGLVFALFVTLALRFGCARSAKDKPCRAPPP